MKMRFLALFLVCGTLMAQSGPATKKEDATVHELALTKAKLAQRDAQLAQAQAQIAQMQATLKIAQMQETIADSKKTLGLDSTYDWNFQSEDYTKQPNPASEAKK